MFSKKLKKIISTVIILGLMVVMISCSLSKIIHNKAEKEQYTQTIIVDKEESQKVLEKETVITSLNECANLSVMSVSMIKEVTFTEGDWFKKSQSVQFTLSGEYILELDSIKSENVMIDGYDIIIYSKPLTSKATFEENQTMYGELEKGFLTFGDIELTPEKMESVKSELKQSILDEMDKQQNIKLAEEKASSSIKNVLSTLTKNQYNVNVIFVGGDN